MQKEKRRELYGLGRTDLCKGFSCLKLTLAGSPQSAGLSQYLAALKRIDYALQNLNSTNLKSNQQAITEFTSLLNFGSQKLQDLFRSMLKQNVEPIEPLHYLTKREPFYTRYNLEIHLLTMIVQSSPFPQYPKRPLPSSPQLRVPLPPPLLNYHNAVQRTLR